MSQLKVACLLGQGFEDSEFRIPYDHLWNDGFAVDIIGAETGATVKGYRGKESVRIERAIGDVEPSDYAALFLPGGQSPDHLRADARFVAFVREFDSLGRPVAAVCHGPQLLITAGLVRGRTLTAWKTIQEDLRQMGAEVKDQAVVLDRNWITSRQPEDLEAFSKALLAALHKIQASGHLSNVAESAAPPRPGVG
jgi:protease I